MADQNEVDIQPHQWEELDRWNAERHGIPTVLSNGHEEQGAHEVAAKNQPAKEPDHFRVSVRQQ